MGCLFFDWQINRQQNAVYLRRERFAKLSGDTFGISEGHGSITATVDGRVVHSGAPAANSQCGGFSSWGDIYDATFETAAKSFVWK